MCWPGGLERLVRRASPLLRTSCGVVLLILAGCGDDEPESLREALARLSEDTVAEGSAPPPDTAAGSGDVGIDTSSAGDPAADTTADEEETDGWTAGIVEQPRSGMEPATLREVRAARNEEFDRVVFEFDGDRVPGYHTEYVDRPVRECGSGEAVEVAGEGWLLVRLEPSRAHEFDGETAEATVTERDRDLDYPLLRQLTLICDFEGQVEWVLGLSSPNRYRVFELREPARLVVDVRH